MGVNSVWNKKWGRIERFRLLRPGWRGFMRGSEFFQTKVTYKKRKGENGSKQCYGIKSGEELERF